MISVTQAQESIDQHANPLAAETLPLASLRGHVLREPVPASDDMPAFDRSAMDGYAIRDDDTASDYEVIAQIRAGQSLDLDLKPGQAVRIFTGARLPGHGLVVIMQEHVEAQAGRIHITKRIPATNVRHRGEDARAGEILLEPGAALDAVAIALLASIGKTAVLVSPPPRILHLTTGDEIISSDQTPAEGQIRNSNAPLIAGLCRESGVEAITHFHAPDDLAALLKIVSDARPETFDLILISGGSGQGSYDFSGEVFQQLGAAIQFREVNVRPGKPLIFGATTRGQIVFGLPGNALSHFVCFHLFVRRALHRLLGRPVPAITQSFLAEPMPDTHNSRETWWPARASFQSGRLECRALPWKSSGDITRLPAANALIHVPASTSRLDPGTMVEILPARKLF